MRSTARKCRHGARLPAADWPRGTLTTPSLAEIAKSMHVSYLPLPQTLPPVDRHDTESVSRRGNYPARLSPITGNERSNIQDCNRPRLPRRIPFFAPFQANDRPPPSRLPSASTTRRKVGSMEAGGRHGRRRLILSAMAHACAAVDEWQQACSPTFMHVHDKRGHGARLRSSGKHGTKLIAVDRVGRVEVEDDSFWQRSDGPRQTSRSKAIPSAPGRP